MCGHPPSYVHWPTVPLHPCFLRHGGYVIDTLTAVCLFIHLLVCQQNYPLKIADLAEIRPKVEVSRFY